MKKKRIVRSRSVSQGTMDQRMREIWLDAFGLYPNPLTRTDLLKVRLALRKLCDDGRFGPSDSQEAGFRKASQWVAESWQMTRARQRQAEVSEPYAGGKEACSRRNWHRIRENCTCAECGEKFSIAGARYELEREGRFFVELGESLEDLAKRQIRERIWSEAVASGVQ